MSKAKQEIFPNGTIFEKIFNYLWKHPPDIENRLQINIPDTIIFKNTLPVFWYFTDKNNNIKRKKKENTSIDNIYEAMTDQVDPDQVCCYFMYSECCEKKYDPTKKCEKYSGLTYINQESQVKIQYFDSKDLKDFLYAEKIPISAGILQKFVAPPSENNSVFQVMYGSKISQYLKITNKLPFNSVKIDKYERCCTFDGPLYFSQAQSAAKFTALKLKNEVDKILEHLKSVSFGILYFEKADFFFKIDKNENLCLLFMSNAKLKSDQCLSDQSAQRQVFKFREIEPIQSLNPLKPYQIQKLVVCLRCQKKEVPNRFIEIPYSYIIQEKNITKEENLLYLNNYNAIELQHPREISGFADNEISKRSNESQNNNTKLESKELSLLQITISSDDQQQDLSLFKPKLQEKPAEFAYQNHEIPNIFSMLHHKLDFQSYQKIKDEFFFSQQKVRVCLNCYMEITPYLEIVKSRGIVSQKDLQFRQNRIKESRSLDSKKYDQNQLQYVQEFKNLNDQVKLQRKFQKQGSKNQKIEQQQNQIIKCCQKQNLPENISSYSNREVINNEQASQLQNIKDSQDFQRFKIQIQNKMQEQINYEDLRQKQGSKTEKRVKKQDNQSPLRLIDFNLLRSKRQINCTPQSQKLDQFEFSPLKFNLSQSINRQQHSSISTRLSSLSNSRYNTPGLNGAKQQITLVKQDEFNFQYESASGSKGKDQIQNILRRRSEDIDIKILQKKQKSSQINQKLSEITNKQNLLSSLRIQTPHKNSLITQSKIFYDQFGQGFDRKNSQKRTIQIYSKQVSIQNFFKN
ncbi:hypothetical protein TTHERM_00657650 (macronuclear) [Tetrahymena thermophila SB210]|uniref:Uncharacterized protein n=1 Tax=Tetrahymena thermophila (strain SB210) TaxID=312017 RepID=I7MM22_TETTS|nr:hypothetical protein TTHERM_00657650 [Tetrahymena thermophila SB210]EAS03820.2 hypothetical protein TTHERM_00657650 [Tetrahymena thermophila SB210]|eukprot:XP_001024065.2 hypothetical protein TTHERM_00657650 [Tetrahymena thermophila SB210]